MPRAFLDVLRLIGKILHYLTFSKNCDIIFIENKKGNKTMEIIKIVFALILTFIFFYELLQNNKKLELIMATVTYILFVIIVSSRSFF